MAYESVINEIRSRAADEGIASQRIDSLLLGFRIVAVTDYKCLGLAMVEYMTELLLWRYLNWPDDEFTGVVPDGMSQIQSPALEQNTTEEFRQGLAQRNEDFKKALSTNNDGATATPLKDASDVHWGPSPQRLVKDDDAASDRSDVVWTRPQYLQNGSEKIAEDTHSEPPRNAASDCSDVLWIPSQLRQPEIAT